MLSETTIQQLRLMKIPVMADEYARQMTDPSIGALSFDDRFGLIVEAEFSRRRNKRLSNLIKKAGFPDRNACIENISYAPERKLNPSQIQQIASCAYIDRKQNVQILGATGVGKTYLANAFGIAACRKSYSVKYICLQNLLIELAVSTAQGEFNKLFTFYKNVRLLIIDDWLMFDIANDNEAAFLYHLIDARMYTGSTIICSQIDAQGWHDQIRNKIAADSICDRIVNSSFKIVVEGEMRKKLAQVKVFAEA